jgi:UDP-N-acetylglucosamine 2-epimerase (non-hydrolysing)
MQENNETNILATDYADTNVSIKVVRIIQSYTKIINKVVWGKNK